jgi:hypothetical protein
MGLGAGARKSLGTQLQQLIAARETTPCGHPFFEDDESCARECARDDKEGEMKAKLTVLTAALAAAAVGTSPALADSGPPFQPGPNCHGQTVAFVAQLAGGVAHFVTDPSQVKEFQKETKAACDLITP